MAGLLNPLLSESLSDESLQSAKVRRSELLLFTSQLSVMLSSGVVLSDAVESITAQTKPGTFQDILFDISDRLQNGESLSAALSVFPRVFTPMFVSIVEASEASGRMPEMLEVLQEYLESEAETRNQIKGAMIYPLIMMIMAVIATSTLLFFVLPKFTKIYESRGRALPKLTQLLIDFSRLISDFKSASLILTVLLVFAGAVFYVLSTSWGKKILDYLKIRTPVLGTMFIDAIMTRSTG